MGFAQVYSIPAGWGLGGMRKDGYVTISVKVELRQRLQEFRARMRVRSYSMLLVRLMDSYDGFPVAAFPSSSRVRASRSSPVAHDSVNVEKAPELE